MHSHNNGYQEPSPESIERRHEQEDLSPRSIVSFLAILMASTGGIALLMVLLLHWFGTQGIRTDEPPSPLAASVQMPPEPRLQALPSIDLKQMREHDSDHLTSYGWISREANVARMPVSAAMDLLVQRGLPVWPITITQTQVPAEGEAPGATVAIPPAGEQIPPAPANAPGPVPAPAAPATPTETTPPAPIEPAQPAPSETAPQGAPEATVIEQPQTETVPQPSEPADAAPAPQ